MVAPVRIALLGGIDVDVGDGLNSVTGTKLRALLAMLALSLPHPAPDDWLIEELWGDDHRANPSNTLQAQVLVLRRLLGRDAIVRRPGGYLLDVDVDDIDAHRLERLVTEGRRAAARNDHPAAATAFTAAVALIRGAPLAQLRDHHFARIASARLDEFVLGAHSGLVDAELVAGRHADVVPRLTDLIAAHPLWERFHAQLMTALYRCDRQGDALRAYRNARRVLIDELGVEPGPELQALERAVLTHDTALSAPALLTMSTTPRRPASRTSFIGRTDELSALATMVSTGRLVTVVGPGGVGKTRLVLEDLARRSDDEETWFVELAPVIDPLAVPETIATAIGARDNGADGEAARAADVRCVDRIGGRDVVIVLDNCEHVIDVAADWAATLLDACPRLRIIATSRQPLGIAGERQLPLEPLDDAAAAQLFQDRAAAVRPSFTADPRTVADLCERLDRLPLAIELAAARVKTLPTDEIVARLEDRFNLLDGASRTADDRHRGLRAAIDWSFDALFADEQRIFCRLAVFAGGATIEAATAVCGREALDVITRLVDKSLVVADTSGHTARFGMLESLRQYGLDRLAETGDLDDAVADHRGWCTALAERAELGVRRGGEQLGWMATLDAEHDNLRAALSRPDPVSAPGDGLRLVAALLLPWWLHDRRQEARHWVDTHLAASDRAPPAVVAKAEAWCGLLASSTGWIDRTGGIEHELALAADRQRRALVTFAAAGDEIAAAYCRLLLAFNILRRDLAGMGAEVAEIDEHVTLMNEVFEHHGDDFGAALAHVTAALRDVAAGHLRRAAQAVARASHHAERSGERFSRARVALISGMLAAANGDLDAAQRHISDCMGLHEQLGMGQEVTSQAILLAAIADARHQPAMAQQWRTFVASRHGGASRDDLLITASARNTFGVRARRAGQLAAARAAHVDALARFTEAGASGAVAITHNALGYLAAACGDDSDAAVHHVAALDAAVAAEQPAALAQALEGIAATIPAGEARIAAVLLGAADSLWRATPARGAPPDRDDVLDTIERVRRAIGADEFRSAFRQGTSTSSEAAVSVARRAGH